MGCGSSSSNGSAYQQSTTTATTNTATTTTKVGQETDEGRDRVQDHLPLKRGHHGAHSISLSVQAAQGLHQPSSGTLRRVQTAERSTISSTGKHGTEEPMTELDLQMYEAMEINAFPTPLVHLPARVMEPLEPEEAAKALRTMETHKDVLAVVLGGLVLLSPQAEQLLQSTGPDDEEEVVGGLVIHHEGDESARSHSCTVASVLRILERIYAIWNTPAEIPHLQFDPTIQRGSIIGGQTGFGPTRNTPPAKGTPRGRAYSTNTPGTPASEGKSDSIIMTAPISLGPSIAAQTPRPSVFKASPAQPTTTATTKLKRDPKPTYVGEYVAFLKLWELELVRDQHLYMLPSNRSYLVAARDSARAFENLISVAVTRGTFCRTMYSLQDQYLLSQQRVDFIQRIRTRINRKHLTTSVSSLNSAPTSSNDVPGLDTAEGDLMKRFSKSEKELQTHLLFQSSFQPLDFSLDLHGELNNYIQGTRLPTCRAFWQWVHVNTAMPSYEEDLAEQEGGLRTAMSSALIRRVFWYRGSPGVGKTNLSALLAEVFHDHILAVHFCKHDREERKNPLRMIRSIAFQLSQRIPEYAAEIKTRLEKMAQQNPAAVASPPTPSSSNSAASSSPLSSAPSAYLDSLSALDLFDQLLVQPLTAIGQPASIAKSQKMVILIDAIDECESSEGEKTKDKDGSEGGDNMVLKILLQQVSLLPGWIGLCLTSRPSDQIVKALTKSKPTEISCDSRDNLTDLKRTVTSILTPHLAPKELDEAVDVLVAKSKGIILYIRLVLDDKLSRLQLAYQEKLAAIAAAADPASPVVGRDGTKTSSKPNTPVVQNLQHPGDYPVTLADIKSFPEGLHAYYQECLENVASFLHAYKQPLTPIMHIVQLLLCAMEPLSPALVATLQQGTILSQPGTSSGQSTPKNAFSPKIEMSESMIIRMLDPLRALFPYRYLDATRPTRGKYCVVHKSLKDWMVDQARLASKKEAIFHVNLRSGHGKLAEKCWKALQLAAPQPDTPMDGAGEEGQPGQKNTSILSEPIGAVQAREDFLRTNPSSELPPSLVPLNTPLLKLDDTLGPSGAAGVSVAEVGINDAIELVPSQPNRDGILSYAIRFGPAHAILSDDMCGSAAFLCHLQYLHMRASLGESSLLSFDYLNAARLINSKARGWVVDKRLEAGGGVLGGKPPLAPTTTHKQSYSWLGPSDAASGIINFQSFYQQEIPHWLNNMELIYQYALAFPDDSLVCRVARSLISWYLQSWPRRKMGLVNFDNKPQALGALMITLRGHGASVQCVSYSPDGKTLASGSIDRSIRLWNAETGELRTELKGHGYHINCLAYSPDGKRLASGGSDNTIRLWDTATNECTRTLQGDDVWFHSVQFSPDGRKLCCGVSDWAVWIWDMTTFEVEMKLEGHKDKIYSTCYSPDGKMIASGSEDETIRIWASSSGKLVHEIKEGHPKGVACIKFDDDGVRMLSSGMDGVVRLWSCDDWSLMKEMKGHEKCVTGVTFHPDHVRIISCSDDRTIKIWNSLNGQLLHTFYGHAEEINAIMCSPNGARIASCSSDRSLMLWDSQLEVTRSSLAQASSEGKGHTGSIYSVHVSPDAKRLVSCGEDKTIKLWSTSGRLVHELKGHKEGVLAAIFIAGGTRVVSGSTDSSIRFWNTQTGKELETLQVKEKTGFVWCLVASPDGQELVSGSTDANLRVWNCETGELVRTIKGPKGMIYSVAYSPDGKRLVCGSETKVIRVYDVTGDLKMELAGHTGDIHSVCFSPDNRFIASGSYDRTIGIWDATSGKSIRYLNGHTGWVNCVAFSPNGKWLVSGGADATIRIWSVATGEQVSVLTGHNDSVLFVKFSSDGSQLLSTGKHRDQSFRVWSFAPVEGENMNVPPQIQRVTSTSSSTSPGAAAFLSTAVPVSVPIGARMASQFEFRTEKGGLVAGCIQVSCHS